MYYAFSEHFPLRSTPLRHSPALIRHSTVCCASRSPRVSNASRPRLSKTKKARPRTRTPQTGKHEPTVAELSEQLSQTIGLDIIKSDLQHIYSFFRSFVKVKTVHHNEGKSSQTPTNRESATAFGHDSESSMKEHEAHIIASPHYKQGSYAPKSKLGQAVASNYVAVQGSMDRTMESLSLATHSFLLRVIATAGSTMYLILEAGQRAFPAINFSPAKRATQQMIENGWNPLKSFQWQTAASSDTRKLEERQRERVEYLKSYLRGKSGGPWTQTLTFTSRSVSTTFSVFENISPVLIQGASTLLTVGYGGLKALGHWGTLGSEANRLQNGSPRSLASFRASVALLDNLPPLPSKPAKAFFGKGKELPKPTKERGPENQNSSTQINVPLSPLQNGLNEMVPPVVGNKFAKRNLQKDAVSASGNSSGMLKKGGAVVGAGILMMATSGVSLPAAVTCSALVITTLGVTQAKAVVNDNDLHREARVAFRQSQSVRKLEKVILPKRGERGKQFIKKEHNATLEVSLAKPALSTQNPSERFKHSAEGLGVRFKATAASEVDVATYAVGPSQPSILSVPVVGHLLNTADNVAYRIETLSSRLFYRLGAFVGFQQRADAWVLLRSFRRKS